ncbi:mitochondrial fission process protein 1 [Trichogramma pretiosum]|uniref:mitochondrial fission process protein 1 n=1 Tax=Trichogramma pretiosum TaxID=7493 RepID=UPI0006C9442B|nr:mitochondrial fission process protein 1 [Trichogramma pretiosum]
MQQYIVKVWFTNIVNMSDDSISNDEIDIFRDTNVRYLGYSNEVGEAFRSIVPKSVVWSSYIAACGYVLADTLHKGYHTYQNEKSPNQIKKVVLSTSDTLIWQGFASVIIPGLTINRICALTHFIQNKTTARPLLRSPWISTIVGLVSIPFIIHPIDEFVEKTMNSTYRQWTGYKPKKHLSST